MPAPFSRILPKFPLYLTLVFLGQISTYNTYNLLKK